MKHFGTWLLILLVLLAFSDTPAVEPSKLTRALLPLIGVAIVYELGRIAEAAERLARRDQGGKTGGSLS